MHLKGVMETGEFISAILAGNTGWSRTEKTALRQEIEQGKRRPNFRRTYFYEGNSTTLRLLNPINQIATSTAAILFTNGNFGGCAGLFTRMLKIEFLSSGPNFLG